MDLSYTGRTRGARPSRMCSSARGRTRGARPSSCGYQGWPRGQRRSQRRWGVRRISTELRGPGQSPASLTLERVRNTNYSMIRLKLPLDAWWLGIALAVVSCGWGAAAAGPPQQDGSVFLEVQLSLIGHGSDPYLVETENASQNWKYERVVSGFLELAATTTSVGEGPDQRELITYVPKLRQQGGADRTRQGHRLERVSGVWRGRILG